MSIHPRETCRTRCVRPSAKAPFQQAPYSQQLWANETMAVLFMKKLHPTHHLRLLQRFPLPLPTIKQTYRCSESELKSVKVMSKLNPGFAINLFPELPSLKKYRLANYLL